MSSDQAEALREARLAAAAARAAKKVARVRVVSAEMRAREESTAAERAAALEQKLERAATSRKEGLEVLLGSQPEVQLPQLHSY